MESAVAPGPSFVVLGNEVIDFLHKIFDALNDPRRIAFSVISAKKRSTMFSQEL